MEIVEEAGESVQKNRIYARYARGEISLDEIPEEIDKISRQGEHADFWTKVGYFLHNLFCG